MSNLKIFTNLIEEEAKEQINNLISQPAFSDCKIRIMPDVHAGAGCVIGFTANFGDKIIPNIVGVDIGCGMHVIPLGNIEIDYKKLDNTIKEYVPCGQNVHNNSITEEDYFHKFYCYKNFHDIDRLTKTLGSLGGGNHFIEIDKDESENKYLIIHTGSRNLGKQVADIYQNIAIKYCNSKKNNYSEIIKTLKEQGRQKEIQSKIAEMKKTSVKIPNELCYIEKNDRENYLHDMKLCQEYAIKNREKIANIICNKMNWYPIDVPWHCVHNYIDNENMIRKGAISAKLNEKVIIPLNMRDGCILGIGKGNEDWNCSAPHGAGRIMSRKKAKEKINIDDFKNSMNGIYSTSVNTNTIDESPMAYKPMDSILSNIEETIDIIKIIKPAYNFKADN